MELVAAAQAEGGRVKILRPHGYESKKTGRKTLYATDPICSARRARHFHQPEPNQIQTGRHTAGEGAKVRTMTK
jgi:hypothetical protein